ncbi:MAG: homoserine O-succinyltransferase [Alphaproteobacteria bacterium]|nr:homoserine O-succinyltransferase [Alphaproteobacteria bacterium]
MGQKTFIKKIGILNLMPLKKLTEVNFVNILSNHPDIEVQFIWLKFESYTTQKQATIELLKSYQPVIAALNKGQIDALIITGAPVELLNFEEVKYWQEIQKVFDIVAQKHIAILTICWAAQAALYYYHHIQKNVLPQKASGVFQHKVIEHPITRNLAPIVLLPVSRYTVSSPQQIKEQKNLQCIVTNPDIGDMVIVDDIHKRTYFTGHAEYAVDDLKNEYLRDFQKLSIQAPKPLNYDVINPQYLWKQEAITLYNNWLSSLI